MCGFVGRLKTWELGIDLPFTQTCQRLSPPRASRNQPDFGKFKMVCVSHTNRDHVPEEDRGRKVGGNPLFRLLPRAAAGARKNPFGLF